VLVFITPFHSIQPFHKADTDSGATLSPELKFFSSDSNPYPILT